MLMMHSVCKTYILLSGGRHVTNDVSLGDVHFKVPKGASLE